MVKFIKKMFKKKEDAFEWRIDLRKYECEISLFVKNRCLFSEGICRPLIFLRLRMWLTKSKLKFLYYQSTNNQE